MDYKETLLLPQTDFPMRGNLAQNEPGRYQAWNEAGFYQKMQEKRKGAIPFNLHDGPPYANGHTHIGHALNKILKDMIVKYHYFQGKQVSYVPGWDCHGLPIEQQVEKKIGKEKKDTLPKSKIRELCRQHARDFIDKQRTEFKALGVLGQWDHPYKTMDFRFEADIYRALCEIAKKGLVAERSKPVYWSWACTTALAEAEVEYEEKESDSIYVAFPLQPETLEKIGVEQAAVVIWTTTPWTLPANVGIALHPEEEYALTENGYIVAKALHEVLAEAGVIDGVIIKSFVGAELEHQKAFNPLNGRDSVIVLGDHVEMTGGTGAVHTAPGHGEDDYRVGLKYGLPVVMPVDEQGKFDETVVREGLLPDAELYVGMHIFDANPKILVMLGDKLLKSGKLKHSYPHCWRSHQPVIFRATKQWFVLMDKPIEEAGGRTLREIALSEIDTVRFYPESGKNRLRSMIENRPDWCISRQRDWGVPIAFLRDKTTGEVIFDTDVLEQIAEVFEEKGADAWWDLEAAEFLPEDSAYQSDQVEKVLDILDVWFDSGSTWLAVLQNDCYMAGNYPADIYLEGSDQHRGWFQSSLLVSCAVNHHAPYKSIVTHGFTMDEKGEKMSKSKGNVVAPMDILKQYGGEILRLWVAMSDYQSDQKISQNILKQLSEQYRKIRNTLRFLLGGVSGLEKICSVDEMGPFDRWILSRAKQVFDEVHQAFGEYEFSKGFHLLNTFVVSELSGEYLDMCKDRLYCDGNDWTHRQASQSVMALIARSLLGLIAPVLTYTCDEVLEYAPECVRQGADGVLDLRYEPLPEVESPIDSAYLQKAREKFYELVDGMKKEKTIKNTLELDLYSDSDALKTLPDVEVQDWFLVSNYLEEEQPDAETLAQFQVGDGKFTIYKSIKSKCPRCWRHQSESEEALCDRCLQVVSV